MQPQRPKRLPTDFFDRLLTDQTDDQINDLLSTLVDEQISPSTEAEKEEVKVNNEPTMIFEPAEPQTSVRELPQPDMEDFRFSGEDELDVVTELEPDRPVDNLIPPSSQMRSSGNLADTIVEAEAPMPTEEDLTMMFPGVPEDPTAPVEADSSERIESTIEEQFTPPTTQTEEEFFPGLDQLDLSSETAAESSRPPTSLTDSGEDHSAGTRAPEEEISGLDSSSVLPEAKPDEQLTDTAEVENLFGMTEVDIPQTQDEQFSWTTEEPVAEKVPEPVSEAQPVSEAEPVALEPTEKILTHQELIHARMTKRWESPKRQPKAPKLASIAPAVAIDQTKLSALDDYLQERHKAGGALFLSHIQRKAIWFILPAFIAFSLFSWYPMLKGLFLSFFNFQPTGESIFIGLQNYTRAFKDLMFLKTLWHGGLFCSLALILGFIPPIFLAIFINEFRRGKSLLKFLFFLPFLMPTVPAAILWKWIMDQGYGLLNSVIALLPIADPHIGWLTNPNLAMLSIVLMYVWKNTGWAMLIYTAALMNTDVTLYEEAETHGATIMQKVRYITLPMIKSTIAVMFIITIINTIQLFTEVYIMTNGGPMNSTEVLATYIYKQAFFYMDIGYASALSILMLIMLLVITIFRLRRLD